MHGLGWELFVQNTNHVHKAVVLLVFTIAEPNPRISVAFMEYANNEEHNEEDYESSACCSESSVGSDDEEASCYIVSRRVHLKTDENDRLVQLLPVTVNVGVPFVTRLTITNLKRHDMVHMCLFPKLKFKKNCLFTRYICLFPKLIYCICCPLCARTT